MSRDVTWQPVISREIKAKNLRQTVTSRGVMGCFDFTSGAINQFFILKRARKLKLDESDLIEPNSHFFLFFRVENG